MFRSPLDHHQGAHRSYPKVTTDHLLVRYTVVLRQHCCVRLCPCSTVDVCPALLGLVLWVGHVVRTSFHVKDFKTIHWCK